MRKRIVKYQPLRDITAREFKDYTEWKELNEETVNLQAEPELLSDSLSSVCPELTAILQVLEEGGERYLTDMQARVFQLVLIDSRSIQEAAIQLGISKATAQVHLSRAAKKLRELCHTKLD